MSSQVFDQLMSPTTHDSPDTTESPLYPVRKLHFRLPAERGLNLGAVDRIPQIMPFSVRNICDQTLRLFELSAYHFHDVDVLYIIERPINLRCSSSKDNAIR